VRKRLAVVGAASILLGLVMIEVTLRVLWKPPQFFGPGAYAEYTAEERNRGLVGPQQLGKACLRQPPRAWNYHPYFGFQSRVIDAACARAHFASGRLRVIYLGGSVMINAGAPNALTTIDFYAMSEVPGLVSLNLAESGARSTNELIRLLLEVVPLRPDVVVFLDGYNEFNAIRYGGQAEEDYYWAAGVEELVHRPYTHYLHALADKVRLFELVLYRTGLVRSTRLARPRLSEVPRAAEYYLERTEQSQRVCDSYGIRCVFMLQPYLYAKEARSPTEQSTANYFSRARPQGAQILNKGYQYIRTHAAARGLHLVDLSRRPEPETLFFDECHLNKRGNAIVGRRIAEEFHRPAVPPGK